MTLALLTRPAVTEVPSTPRLLVVEGTAGVAAVPACVVDAGTPGSLAVRLTVRGMSITDTLAADTDVLDGIKVPLGHRSIRLRRPPL